MRIWSYDPGAQFTGMVALSWYGQEITDNDVYWWADTDVAELYDEMIRWEVRPEDRILVEDFTHGGAFTLEAKKTIEVVGFLTTQAARDGFTVVRRHKDKRLSAQAEAARQMGSTVAALKKDVAQKDAFSALAHAIAFTREYEPNV